MRAVTAAQMRAIDAAAVARDGEVELMRQAGAAIARVVPRYRQDGPIIALAGNGNNGGDAFAALARLEGRRILYYDPGASWGAARMHAFQRARASGVELRRYPVNADDLRDAGLLLDGLLGVNARLPLDAATAERVHAINDARRYRSSRSTSRPVAIRPPARSATFTSARPRRLHSAGRSSARSSIRDAMRPATCGARRSACTTAMRTASISRRTC